MKNFWLKNLFIGLLSVGLIFSVFGSAFAAGGGNGGGAGNGNGGGSGDGSGNPDPVLLVDAYLTTITGNVSTTGKEIKGSNTVDPNPVIKVTFNKNVVNDTVWVTNSQAFALTDSDSNIIDIHVARIPDEGANANPNEKRNIFISPVEPLTLGKEYTLTIKSSLSANNTSTLGHKETITFTIKTETAPPILRVTAPNNSTLTNKETIAVTGSTEAGSIVKINEKSVTVDENGLFTQEVTLLPGLNKIKITSTDELDNTTFAELQVTYDHTAPVITIDSPADNFVSNMDKITIKGTSEKDAAVKINGLAAELDSNGAFSQEIALVKGENTISVTSTDPAGNTAVTEWHVTYDMAPVTNDGNGKEITAKNTNAAVQHELPDTAGNMFNWLLAGALVAILGISLFAVPRLRGNSK
ncbi:hypothetical protein [Neobacillus muris]|uniref:hypothetical protein n=1 Tax=Neobacillus muris TaxID=2941334 RepID=UPI0020402344|nr:hypothetical protein [Neobacillus muris]